MKYRLIILFLFVSCKGTSQGNPHFFKFIFENEKGEVLLTDFKGKWEVPGARFTTNSTINEFTELVASKFTLHVVKSDLRGLFTFHHEVRDRPTMMLYFLVRVESQASLPSGSIWLEKEQAFKRIDYGEMREIVKRIYEEKQTLFKGKVIVKYDSKTKLRNGKFWVDWH